MIRTTSIAFLAAALSAGALASAATTYNDTVGEEFSGNSNLDIKSVQVSNTATDITFSIQVNSNIVSGVGTDWGKYMVGIDSAAGGDTSGNGWGRPISMSNGMDYWIGSWVDTGGGEQVWQYSGTAWSQTGSSTPFVSGDTVTLTTSLASLGLSTGSTFNFDVYAGGGNTGDSANDASSNPAQSTTGWGGPYDSGSTVSSYTVTAVPEPALGLLAVAALPLLRRRRAR